MKSKLQYIIGLALCALLIIGIVNVYGSKTPLTRIEYTVRPGDTLWDIAKEYAPRGTDIQEYIFNTKKNNGLKTSSLQPGMILELVTEDQK